MSQALTTIYYILDKFINFVFNDAAITDGVTVGWVIIAVSVFGILIGSILNLPRRMSSFDKFREHTYVNQTKYSDGSTSWRETRSFRR